MSNTEIIIENTGKQEFAELLCDFMFKRLFGSNENKDVLIGFLNTLLEDVKIIDVEFIPTEHQGITEEDRKAIFDISARCDDGRTLIFEVQNASQQHFRKRAVYYTSYPINEQGRLAKEEWIREHECKDDGKEFKWDFNLKPVTVIGILNFKFEHDASWPSYRYHSSYRLREDTSNEVMTDVLRFVFLELGRFNKRIWELETTFDKWMHLFKHMHELVEIPKIFQTPEFNRLFILSKIGKFTPEEMKEYQNSLDKMSDYYNTIESAEDRGRKQERIRIAEKMLETGMPIDQIAQITDLTSEEIEALR